MSLFRNFCLLFVLVILSVKGDGKQFAEKGVAQTACLGPTSLAPSQNRQNTPQLEATECGLQEATIPSLWGQSFPPPNCERNVLFDSYRLALRSMPQNEIAECLVLRPLWQLLGRLCCTHSQPEQFYMGTAEQETKREEPKAKATMQIASPPPPPPPMLAPNQAQCHAPWMPQQMPQQMPHMNMMPFMPPQLDQQVMQTVPQQSAMMPADLEDYKMEMSAQTKLNKIMKAAKKEDHLSPEFQSLVATERKKDDKESTSNLLAAVKAHGKAKEALMEVENSRMQLWSQWRVFLQASVTKWKEYTAQFQASETAFQHQMQSATLNLRKAQKRVDLAKKRADAVGKDDEPQEISDDDFDENEPDMQDEAEVPRDENAQRIQEGLHQVVTSLSVLSESAEKLEPKSKRPRIKEEEEAPPGSRAMQPFGMADCDNSFDGSVELKEFLPYVKHLEDDKKVLMICEEESQRSTCLGESLLQLKPQQRRASSSCTRKEAKKKALKPPAPVLMRKNYKVFMFSALDIQEWNEDDLFPRELQHGTYLKIEVTAEPQTQVCPPQHVPDKAKQKGPDTPHIHGPDHHHEATSLMQRPLQHQDQRWGPMSHSAMFPSLAGRPTVGHGESQHQSKIVQEQAPKWMHPVKMTFLECAAIEFDDEGPVLYWKTWFLHHQRYTRSFESRTLRLDAAHKFWFQELCDLWADAMDPHLPARVAFVHPKPPMSDNDQHVGHLILVQGQGRELPVLMTALFDHPLHRRVWHLAALQLEYVEPENVFDDLGIARWCNRIHCRIHIGEVPFGQHELVHLQEGDSLVITIPSVQRSSRTEGISLMQRGLKIKSKQPIQYMQTGSAQNPSVAQACGEFQLNPAAAPFDPNRPGLRALSEFEADLWVQWDQEAFAWDDEERSCTILTWFIDHTWHWPHCDHPRRLQLYEDHRQWEELILRRWQDVRDPRSPFELYVVDPRPPALNNDIAAHVLIIQKPFDAWITNLATIIDSTQGQHQPFGQIAITTHEHVRVEAILTATSLERVCLYQSAVLNCQVWFQGVQLPPGVLFPGRSGTGIEIYLWPKSPTAPQAEGHGFLQIPSRRRREEERRTGSAVAQACRPSPVTLQLSTIIKEEDSPIAQEPQEHTWGVKLQAGHPDIIVPEYLEVPFEAGKARLKMIEIEVPPWKTDIETHETTVRRQLQSAMQVKDKLRKSRPKKAYLDADTWAIRTQLLKYRKSLKQTRKALARESLYRMFRAWSGHLTVVHAGESFAYGTTLRASQVRTMAGYCKLRVALRSHLQSSKQRLMKQRSSMSP
ncbi:unnamed protein product [Cladocopium goreaui]|uniref:Uncharacterized protein n=1 Tax=Cladocopium goreaui TaxID=2562237 RepID=A0A9P1G8U4_9DINO|nr:unnamed protein product [Cladocopium goreaui]